MVVLAPQLMVAAVQAHHLVDSLAGMEALNAEQVPFLCST